MVLSELEPYVGAEQDFCQLFFHLRYPGDDADVSIFPSLNCASQIGWFLVLFFLFQTFLILGVSRKWWWFGWRCYDEPPKGKWTVWLSCFSSRTLIFIILLGCFHMWFRSKNAHLHAIWWKFFLINSDSFHFGSYLDKIDKWQMTKMTRDKWQSTDYTLCITPPKKTNIHKTCMTQRIVHIKSWLICLTYPAASVFFIFFSKKDAPPSR